MAAETVRTARRPMTTENEQTAFEALLDLVAEGQRVLVVGDRARADHARRFLADLVRDAPGEADRLLARHEAAMAACRDACERGLAPAPTDVDPDPDATAAWVAAERSRLAGIPDAISTDVPCPLSPDEAAILAHQLERGPMADGPSLVAEPFADAVTAGLADVDRAVRWRVVSRPVVELLDRVGPSRSLLTGRRIELPEGDRSRQLADLREARSRLARVQAPWRWPRGVRRTWNGCRIDGDQPVSIIDAELLLARAAVDEARDTAADRWREVAAIFGLTPDAGREPLDLLEAVVAVADPERRERLAAASLVARLRSVAPAWLESLERGAPLDPALVAEQWRWRRAETWLDGRRDARVERAEATERLRRLARPVAAHRLAVDPGRVVVREAGIGTAVLPEDFDAAVVLGDVPHPPLQRVILAA